MCLRWSICSLFIPRLFVRSDLMHCIIRKQSLQVRRVIKWKNTVNAKQHRMFIEIFALHQHSAVQGKSGIDRSLHIDITKRHEIRHFIWRLNVCSMIFHFRNKQVPLTLIANWECLSEASTQSVLRWMTTNTYSNLNNFFDSF